MKKLPTNLEEACLEILYHTPRATSEHKYIAAKTLENLGLGDYLPKDEGEPPVEWDKL